MDMQKNERLEHPEYEIVDITERLRIDPRGLGRLTLLGNNRFIIEKGYRPALSIEQIQNKVQKSISTEEK